MQLHDNLAYDYAWFDEQQQNNAKAVSTDEKTNAKSNTKLFDRLLILLIIVTLGLVAWKLVINTKANEISTEVERAKNKIVELQSEKTRLEMELEARISYENLEEAAKNLGMRKKDASQINYVNADNNDSGVVVDTEDSGNVLSVFADWF